MIAARAIADRGAARVVRELGSRADATTIGAELSTGYEFRGPHLLLRVYAMGVVGASGASPWVGSTVGWAL